MIGRRKDEVVVGGGGGVGPSTPPPQLPQPLPRESRKRCPIDLDSGSSPNKRNHLWCPMATAGGGGAGAAMAAELPVVIRCPCGGGACRVFTSNTEKNPGRRYYTCPANPLRCGFFKWCDDVLKHSAPACPCGAGTSSLNRHLSGPLSGRWYFACRIKKNHGACTFYRMVDFELNALLNKFLPRLMGNSSPSCLATASSQHTLAPENGDSRKEEEAKFDSSPEIPNPGDEDTNRLMGNSSPSCLATASSQHTLAPENGGSRKEEEGKFESSPEIPNPGDEDTNKHLIRLKVTDPFVSARADRARQLILCTSDISLKQGKFLKQVYAACNSFLADETVGQRLGIKFEGWLGRIVFSPPRLLKDPAAPSFFWCVFPSFYPIPCLEDTPLVDAEVVTMISDDSSISEAEPLAQPQQAPRQNDLSLSSINPELLADDEVVMVASDRVDNADAELQQAPQRNDFTLSSFLSDPREVESSASTKTEKALSELVLRCSGPGGVLSLLQSMPVSEHEKMLEVAESIFSSWRCVGVNCGPFSEVVKEYVHCVSRQARVEAAMSEGLSSEQLDAIYREEKSEFDHACQLHRETEAALEASEKQLKWMQGEASCLRDTLMRLEKGIVESEAGIAELKSSVANRYGEKVEAEARVQAATLQMREVWELEQQREMEKNAASGVMERLRGLLQHQ